MQALRPEEVREGQKRGGIDSFCQLVGKLKPSLLSEIRAKRKVEGWRRKWWEGNVGNCLHHY